MIEVTATMFPSTVMNDRSLAPQIASSAIPADSRSLFMCSLEGREGLEGLEGPEGAACSRNHLPVHPALPAQQGSLALRRVHFHRIAVGHAADRVVGAGDDLIAGFQASGHFEILVS